MVTYNEVLYELSGNLKSKKPLFARYFDDALKLGAENGTKKGKIKVICHPIRDGVEVGKPIVEGEIFFTKEKYLPNFIPHPPEIVIYRDLKRITYSK